MADILIHALVAGALTGLGALLGRFVANRLGLAGLARTILLVISVAVPLTMSRHLVDRFVMAPRQVDEVTDAFRSTPLLQIVEAHYPEARAAISEALTAHVQHRIPETEAQRRIREVLLDLKLQTLPQASQSHTLEALRIAREQVALVSAASEPECDSFVMTGFTTTPLEPIFGAALVEREMALVTQLLAQVATSPATWTDLGNGKLVEASIAQSVEKVISGLPVAEREAAISKVAAGGQEHMCRITLALFDSFLSLPPEKAAAAFQYYNSPASNQR